jgi:Zn-dependent protease with chaperone function
MKLLYFILPMLVISSSFMACSLEEGKTQSKTATLNSKKITSYHFKYHTIVRNLERDCSDSKLDERLYWLSDQEENLLRPIKVTEEDEQKIGAQVYECFKKVGFVEGAKRQRVQAIVDKMKPFMTRKNLDLKVNILDLPYQNAFACPDGYVYVTLPLLNAFNDDELACVVGHELCHLENKHCDVHIKKYKLMGCVLTNLFSCLTQGLTQRNELEADLGGVYLAYHAGYDPHGSMEAFKRWAMEDNKPNTLDKIFRSHPYCQERVNCIGAYLKDAMERAVGLSKIK